MNAQARRQIYSLSGVTENVHQNKPFTFHVDTLAERFVDMALGGNSGHCQSLQGPTRHSLCFSDMSAFDDLPVSERRRL